MEEPSNQGSPTSASTPPTMKKEKKEKRPPTPDEILAHYEADGLETRDASLRAISDLQTLLFRAIASRRNSNKVKDDSKLLDNINTRLALLEMKLDTKPGYPQSFSIGLASGAVVSAVSHLATIWNSVKSVTDSNSSS